MGVMAEKEFYSRCPVRYARSMNAPGWLKEIDGVRLTLQQINYLADLINDSGSIPEATEQFKKNHAIVKSGCCFKKWRLENPNA